MSLRLFDSATRQVRDFVPLVPGQAGVYVCGATPQSGPHIGHMRSAVVFDVLQRWLERSGYRVTLVRNVTDIDDKILAKSVEAGVPWWQHALTFEREFAAAYDSVNVTPPTYEPRATGHVTDMVDLIQRLVDAGHAYPAADGSGDVYFDVRSWAQYGELTNQGLDDMEPAGDADPRGKRDPRDFALWKGAKAGEPATASWPTPWGRGRPGWHLECSAMATRYLGPEFDIHGGGLDLRFPHHENEQAQSRAAGDPFSRYWMHNAWVVQSGEKMSKSLGNTMSMEALTRQVPAVVVRYLLTTPHYRSNIEIVDGSLEEARTAYERIENFVVRAAEVLGAVVTDAALADVALPQGFVDAMDDDLGTPAAVAVLHETVRAGNSALAADDKDGALTAALAVRAMADVLGVDPLDPHWRGTVGGRAEDRLRTALDALVRSELDARTAARAAKDFATADAIRTRLSAAGITVEDTPGGARWTLEEKA
ncbi:cysteine--tRNA ligase [Kineosporia sp. R_H_3]|uniref:cysteine--tRNA ligase n=1 Tax=Kineosporia sp. R_H_3 TaxID=1961848 RepID=UPI000B4AAE17|nr:cysteine--tRNA ligase [Kineosporia sp. R_H_3]